MLRTRFFCSHILSFVFDHNHATDGGLTKPLALLFPSAVSISSCHGTSGRHQCVLYVSTGLRARYNCILVISFGRGNTPCITSHQSLSISLRSQRRSCHNFHCTLWSFDPYVNKPNPLLESAEFLFLRTVIHLGQAAYFRIWWLIPTVCFAGLLEILGWAARLWSSFDVANPSPFEMQ